MFGFYLLRAYLTGITLAGKLTLFTSTYLGWYAYIFTFLSEFLFSKYFCIHWCTNRLRLIRKSLHCVPFFLFSLSYIASGDNSLREINFRKYRMISAHMTFFSHSRCSTDEQNGWKYWIVGEQAMGRRQRKTHIRKSFLNIRLIYIFQHFCGVGGEILNCLL